MAKDKIPKEKKVKSAQSNHWNGHLLCAVDVEVYGESPKDGDLLEIAIMPLNPNFTPSSTLPPFDMVILPSDTDKYKSNQILLPGMTLADVMLQGLSWDVVAELLETWKEKLNLPEGKKIIPLGHNYRAHDEKWMRWTLGDLTYEFIFDFHCRDTMEVGLFLNDMADWLKEPIPFPKLDLSYMCSCLRVENIRRHRALGDALATAELYRRIVTRLGPNLLATSRLLQCGVDAPKIGSEGHRHSGDDLSISRNSGHQSSPHQTPASESQMHLPGSLEQLLQGPLSTPHPSPEDAGGTPTTGEPPNTIPEP